MGGRFMHSYLVSYASICQCECERDIITDQKELDGVATTMFLCLHVVFGWCMVLTQRQLPA